ncbi:MULTISPECIES: DNA-binding transcriptional repressor DeoR [unclassified Tatumella]|uniref:DNA-binding transcriptional repressor DeoR n=1 Tax=unclassified Tatumella TaxID=2649542 RepID=UPI001BAEF035|nr:MULTISPECIES: DNA-binding transcriptional repressor DeoR [unclassified Tatumella]MBS0856776.1 DNA-binding transcriptional repressor DeoR [Tatumella sp. JGM16]MBS0894418.1 DNA-binding transcriptional repressor DeoR [Tatumella sp. JGM130]MBS0913268.1 DNA-binding transcriptional repressor DeoR [Tatumella sp. JGM91]
MTETRREQRIQLLLQEIKREQRIHLSRAAALLGVSGMTIRRDLSHYPQQLLLLGGYIVSTTRQQTAHYFISDQQTQHTAQKKQLARLAAALISPQDTVFFDCGTTTPRIIAAIDNSLPFTALTASMNTFLALQEKTACRVILSGGEFHPDNAIFTPVGAHPQLEEVCPALAFISAAGLDERQGVTCYNLNELPMKHRALQRAGHKVLVLDSSKFGKVLPARIADITAFDTLITDQPLPSGLAQQLTAATVRVITPCSDTDNNR